MVNILVFVWVKYICVCIYVGFLSGSAVKNQPEVQELQETQIQSLGWEDPLEEGMATHSSVFAWRIHGQRTLAGYSPWGHKESHD